MDNSQIVPRLQQQIAAAKLPEEVADKLNQELNSITLSLRSNQFRAEVDRQVNYVNFVCSLPWNSRCTEILDLVHAKQVLDKHHYGLDTIKERILEYLSILILNRRKGLKAQQPVLAFVGLVGSGKTTLAYSIAESLGRPLVRIPFGGLGSALQLRGESRVKPEAEPGLIMRSIKRIGVKNPVILLDELDRVAAEGRNDIMGVLVELLDPSQNMAFTDHYVSFPFDLSEVLFVATANNTGNIATAVMDRLELIEMPFYSDEQKIKIANEYLLPQSLKEAGLESTILEVDPTVWPQVVRPLGFDGGIRSLKRNIDNLVRKLAKKVVEGNPGPFKVDASNVAEYLPN